MGEVRQAGRCFWYSVQIHSFIHSCSFCPIHVCASLSVHGESIPIHVIVISARLRNTKEPDLYGLVLFCLHVAK